MIVRIPREWSHPARLPRVWLGLGALAVGSSSVFIDLSGTSPGTSTFYRCLLAIPVRLMPAWRESRSHRRLRRGELVVALLAGAMFAADALLWTAAIFEIGAGLATVLVNAQVLILPLLALLFDRESLGRRYLAALPVMIAGLVLASGIVAGSGNSSHPALGTIHAMAATACYSGFLYLLRRGGAEGLIIQSYVWVIASAALVGLLIGIAWHGVDLAPAGSAMGWLVLTALIGQSGGWLLVALVSPLLPASVSAALLLLTPLGSLLLSVAMTGERPSAAQLLGAALVLCGAYVASTMPNPTKARNTTNTTRAKD